MQEIVGAVHWNNILSKECNKLICFSAKWCGPCKTLKPKLESLSLQDKYNGIEFYTVDVDKSEELCTTLDITSLPTILILKTAFEYKRIVGSNYQQILDDLNSLII